MLEEVASRYDEAHRHYHDRRHLEQVLGDVERLLPTMAVPDADAVRLAALFHDAVYDPRSATNEADSADLAGELLAGRQPAARVAAVRRLVLATASHEASGPDEAVLLDADLAILATDRARYAAFVRAVRLEFGHVPDPAWRAGRAAVLTSLLALPRLFSTPPMQRLEVVARQNLAAELGSLQAGGP